MVTRSVSEGFSAFPSLTLRVTKLGQLLLAALAGHSQRVIERFMPRFTILRHTAGTNFQRAAQRSAKRIAAGPLHWDWLFERTIQSNESPSNDHSDSESGMSTWATDPLLELDASQRTMFPIVTVPALRLPDHRVLYLDFEGEIDGERGTVVQIATGHYQIMADTPLSFQAILTITRSRFIARDAKVVLQLSHSEAESTPTPSVWTLRIKSDSSDTASSTSNANL